MSFGDYIASQFPGQKWTGSSAIHRSLAGSMSLKTALPNDPQQKMLVLHHSAMGLFLWDFLLKRFGEMDWQVSAEEFRAIILVDMVRHLNHEGDTQHPTKLRNPNTGNVFHRLAIRNDIVGGVRIWDESCAPGVRFGFRFRLAGFEGDSQSKVVGNARQKAMSSITFAEKIVSGIQLAEPTPEEVKKIRETITVK